MRPANTERMLGGPSTRAAATLSTWATVIIAVTFCRTPSAASSLSSGPENSPRVLVTGILT